MRGVYDDHVDARFDQRAAAFVPLVADGGGRGHAQAAQIVLAGLRVQHGLFGVLQRQQPGQLARPVGHQQLFDATRLHQADRLGPVGRFAQDGQVVGRHHRPHRGAHVVGEPHVAVGHDPQHAPVRIDDRKAGDVIAVLQRLGVGQGLVRRQGDRVVDDPAFEPLDAADLVGLLFGGQVAMDHAHAACLRHGDRHAAFGDRVHGGRQQRDVHPDRPGDVGGHVSGRGQHRGCRRNQKNVVECEGLTNLHGGCPCGNLVWQFPLSRPARFVQPARRRCMDVTANGRT